MKLLFFLIQVFIISCSGAMQPGPVTAAAVAMGARNRHAGALLAVGHGIIELPLMAVIILGLGKYFELPKVRIVIGLAGGVFLILMAIQAFISFNAKVSDEPKAVKGKPILAGIILSAGNPYFLVWWATVGLALATQAVGWGIWAFALFALTHWSVDLIWLQILSWASSKGSMFFGPHFQRIVSLICALVLLGFGLVFIFSAIGELDI